MVKIMLVKKTGAVKENSVVKVMVPGGVGCSGLALPY
jgi:hypothetical protein